MRAILRNNAVVQNQQQVGLRGGGSGRGGEVFSRPPVGRRMRFPADPAAELMPSAEFLGTEPDFQAILEDFHDGPLDPSRRRVLGRLMGMFAMDYQGARTEERRFLRRVLMGRNAREGYAANRALHLCNAPSILRRTLALAVAESRFKQGITCGFLGAVQARNATITFALLGPRSRERIWNVLTKAATHETLGPLREADRIVERSLILKALAARRHLLGPWSTHGEAAIDEIVQFAEEIRTCTRDHLARSTTLENPDGVKAGDAMKAAQVGRGNIDPIYAWQVHGRKRVLARENPWGFAQSEDALPDLDRSPLLDRTRLHQALAEARQAGETLMSAKAREALTQYVCGNDLKQEGRNDKDDALAVLRDRGFDVVRDEAIESMRDDAKGIYKYDAARAFSMLLGRYSGAMYVRRVFSDQITAGAEPLVQIARSINQGFVVPTILAELRKTTVKPLLILDVRDDSRKKTSDFVVQPGGQGEQLMLPVPLLIATVLPEELGTRVRADAYLAPAALDLLAPPFGVAFPEIGVEDRL